VEPADRSTSGRSIIEEENLPVATTLLAVDDSVTMRKVLEMTFAGEDYRVVTAESAEAALIKVRAERPSIVLCDVTLDGAGGYGLCAKIKAENPTVAVVVLASKQQPYDAPKGQSARADDYIEKPFDTQQLIEKIKRLAGRPAVEVQPAQTAPPARPPAGPGATTQPGVPSFGAPTGDVRSPAAPVARPAPMPPAAPPVPAAAAARPAPPVGMPLNPRPTAPGMGGAGPSPAQQPVGRGTLSYGGVPSATPPTAQAAPPAPAARPPMPPAAPPPAAPVQAAAPAPAPAPVTHAAPVAAAVASATNGQLAAKLSHMGLTDAQVSAVLALSREVVEKVVWEVVPVLAETMIREEIKRLTSE
jgi:CheY-like chemotaxis protein